jgi:hypothetical protein
MEFPIFLRRIAWRIRFLKWIYQITHLRSMVEVLCIIQTKIGLHESIKSFCEKANAVIQTRDHNSRFMLEELERLLQEISDHPTIREFLGHHERTIGGGSGMGEAWSSAKMHHFVISVNAWTGGKIYQFHFRERDSRHHITSDDIRREGHSCGESRRNQISQIRLNSGVSDEESRQIAREYVSTPRSEKGKYDPVQFNVPRTPRTPIFEDSVSIGSLMQTPRQTPRETPRQTPRLTPRFDKPEHFDFLLYILLSETFIFFLRDCYNLSKMQRSGKLWVLYDLLCYFKRIYGDRIFINHALQRSFFQSMRNDYIVKEALRIFFPKWRNDESLWVLRYDALDRQEEFINVVKMVAMHDLWQTQNQSKSNPGIFIYKCSKGAWMQDPTTFDFVLVSDDDLPKIMSQNIETA